MSREEKEYNSSNKDYENSNLRKLIGEEAIHIGEKKLIDNSKDRKNPDSGKVDDDATNAEEKETDENVKDNENSKPRKVMDDDEFASLLQKTEKTLEDLKKASSAQKDKPKLNEDESSPKGPPAERKVLPRMIYNIEKAFRQSKTEEGKAGTDSIHKEETCSSEKKPETYDPKQESLMVAVLGIDEKDKSKNDVYNKDSYSNSTAGTLAGLGDLSQEEVDLRESEDIMSDKSDPQKHTVKEVGRKHGNLKESEDTTSDSTIHTVPESANKEDSGSEDNESHESGARRHTAAEFAKQHLHSQTDVPSTSQDELLNLQKESLGQSSQTEKTDEKKPSGLMQKIHSLLQNLCRKC